MFFCPSPRAACLFVATLFALLGWCTPNALAAQGDIWTDADVKNYFRTTWDWRTNDPTQFLTFYGTPTILPWTPDAAAGIHVAGKDVPQPTQGWRLYDKHLDCTDYGMPANCLDLIEPGSGAILSLLPHFSLYNIYTGVIRTFIWLRKDQENDDRILVLTDIGKSYNPTSLSDLGLFLNAGDLASTLAEKKVERNYGYGSVVKGLFEKWIVIDREISYDPSPVPPDLMFNFQVIGLRRDAWKATGTLSEELDEEHPVSRDFSAYFDFVVGAGKTIAKRLGDVDELENDLNKRAKKLREKKHTELADSVSSVSKVVGLAGPYGALIASAIEIVTQFTRFMNNDFGVQYTPKSMVLELEGSIEGSRPLEEFGVGVYGSTQHRVEARTPVLRHSGKLGLFSLERSPVFEVGDDYAKLIDKNVRSLVVVNPDANMKLLDVKVQPIFSVPVTQECSKWPIQNTLYSEASAVPGLVSDKEPGLRLVRMTEAMADPDKVDFQWDPRSGCYAWDPSIRGYTDNSAPQRILLKIYLKFAHVDQRHGEISTELTRTYEADMIKRPCSLGPSRPSDTTYSTSSRGQVLISDITKYTHRPCNLRPGQVILFKHAYYRGLSGGRAGPQTRVGRAVFSATTLRSAESAALESTAIGNDELSSIMVGPDTEVTLYQHVNFRGASISFTDNVPQLSAHGWNDRVSSVRVRGTWRVSVPNVKGLLYSEAARRLRDHGLTIHRGGGFGDGEVVTQDPSPGELIRVQSSVSVVTKPVRRGGGSTHEP